MSEVYGGDYITIVDEEGQEMELELLMDLDYEGASYTAFLPADMDENDPDYGIVILRRVEEKDGEVFFETVDDDELLDKVYDRFMMVLYADEDEDGQ